MNSGLKAYFLIPAAGASALLILIAIAGGVTTGGDRIAWWAAALANLPLPLFYAKLRFARVPRTSENLPLLILVSAIGTVVALWQFFMAGAAGWQPAAIAVAGTALLLLYIFWYSRFGRMPNARLEVRNKLPHFELDDLEGRHVSSEDFLGKPTVNLFYRGNWCPFCVAQVHEIASRHADIEKAGAQLNLISSQPAEQARELAKQVEAPLRFLIDADAKVARALDIVEWNAIPPGAAAEGYTADAAMPTVVVTSASGTILFADQTDNYRVRPEPDIFIAILRRAGAVAT